MTLAFLSGILASSLLSSLHCAGMCGPFVAFYAGEPGQTRAHWVYHGQRALVYSALGALAGALGSGLDRMGQGLGTLRLAALVASVLTILWGLSAFVPSLRLLQGLPALAPGRLLKFAPTRLVQLKTQKPTTRAFALGLLTPLLPCGTLYAFVTLAAGTGSLANGALTMFVFFLGTVPALLGLGALAGRLGRWFGARLPRVLGAMLVTIGLFGVYERGSLALTSDGGHGQGKSCHAGH